MIMETLILQRGINPGIPYQEPEGTPGSLDGFCTLELPDRDNAPSLSRINAGTYLCIVTHSPHLNEDTYELQSVPGRVTIRIHQGNWAGSVPDGYFSNVEGCILIGHSFGRITPPQQGETIYQPQLAVMSSVSALTSFMQKMQRQPFTLQILDPPLAS